MYVYKALRRKKSRKDGAGKGQGAGGGGVGTRGQVSYRRIPSLRSWYQNGQILSGLLQL